MARDTGWLTGRPITHRGLHDGVDVIENTMAAVEAALAASYAIEIDVRVSADGEAMVFHDADLARLTEATGPLAAQGSATLASLPFRAGGQRMPRLADVLDLVAGRVLLLVEIKSDGGRDRRLEARVADLLSGYSGPVAVQSFDPHSLRAMRRLAPALPRGIISMAYRDAGSRARLPAWHRFAARHMLHAAAAAPQFQAYDATALPAPGPRLLRHLAGLPLLAWTVRDAATAERLRPHVDQIIFEHFRP